MDTYDYVVIGSGSGGSAVAGRLARDPRVRVLVLEAGGSDRRLNVRMPLAFPSLFHSRADWEYYTEPEPGCGGRRLYEPRGRIVGGCGSINGMVWVRGSARDYDGWGLDGWAWKDVEPWFLRMEDRSGTGAGGPNRLTRISTPDPLSLRFMDAAAAAAAPRRADISGPDLCGTSPALVTIWRGRRWSPPRAYLDPVRRRGNLTVLADAPAQRVIIEGGRAVGVEYQRGGRVRQARSRTAVVLAAGAFGTPHLLQLSGIGEARHLHGLGIDCTVDNPHVGEHLAEHPTTFMNWELTPGHTGFADAGRARHLLRWLLRHDGKLASNGFEALSHVKSRPDLADPDVQIGFGAAYFWDSGAASHPVPAVTLAQSYWTPRSRGRVRATSADPGRKPAVRLNLLTAQEDVEALMRAVKLCRAIAATSPLADVLGREIHPGPSVRTDTDLEAWIRRTCGHSYHPCGSARMGPEGAGVLDARLRVRGVSGLRVADASALPDIPHGNTHAAAILMGERCAAFLERERHEAEAEGPGAGRPAAYGEAGTPE